MAKTTAPLLSFGGSGQVGQTLVYGSWRGIPYVRRHVIPANPRTAAQQTTRTTFAMLREMFKVAPTLLREPWDAFAEGRPFIGFNAYIGENLRVLRGEALMTNYIGSPGARGGLPPVSVVATPGANSGDIDVAFTNPDPPPGWTITGEVAVAFPDQDPAADFGGPIVAQENDPPTGSLVLSGLPAGTSCITAAWLVWEKPNGDVAYSVGITDTVMSAA